MATQLVKAKNLLEKKWKKLVIFDFTHVKMPTSFKIHFLACPTTLVPKLFLTLEPIKPLNFF